MQIRTYLLIDQMQPQYGALTGKTMQGEIPVEGIERDQLTRSFQDMRGATRRHDRQGQEESECRGPPEPGVHAHRCTSISRAPSADRRTADCDPMPPAPMIRMRAPLISRTGESSATKKALSQRASRCCASDTSRPRKKWRMPATTYSAIGIACTPAEFVSPLPDPMPPTSAYSGQRFNYYMRVSE